MLLCKFATLRIRAVGKWALRAVVSIVTTVVEVFTVQMCRVGCGYRGVVGFTLCLSYLKPSWFSFVFKLQVICEECVHMT